MGGGGVGVGGGGVGGGRQVVGVDGGVHMSGVWRVMVNVGAGGSWCVVG